MTAALAARIGVQEPRLEVVPESVTTAAALDVIEMATHAGIELDPWQCNVLHAALGERADGKWSAFEVALVVPRRNGKSALIEALILASLFIWRERTVIYSCHRFDAAQETFLRLRQLIEMSDFADEVAKVYTANGKEAIILKSGCRVKFMARSRGTGRGFDGDRIILDEAYDLAPTMLGAMVPTMAARSMLPTSNPQIWYASSAPHSTSLVLHSLRQRALSHKAGDPTRLTYLEWSAADSADPTDVDAWYQANPALGIRIAEDYIQDEMLALSHSPDEFARERLGVPDPLPLLTGPAPKLDADKWSATLTRDRSPEFAPGECVFAFDTHNGRSSIAVAVGTLESSYTEVVAEAAGSGWVPRWLVERPAGSDKTRWELYQPAAFGWDDGNGESTALADDIREQLTLAGYDPERVDKVLSPVSTNAYKAACQSFVNAVDNGTVARARVSGVDALQVAGEVAPWRTIGDKGLFDRVKCPKPFSPLGAAVVARSLLPEIEPVGEWFVY